MATGHNIYSVYFWLSKRKLHQTSRTNKRESLIRTETEMSYLLENMYNNYHCNLLKFLLENK